MWLVLITFTDDLIIKRLNGNQSWIVIGRTDAEAEAPILWPQDVKSLLIRKNPGAGKDWRQEEEKGTTENDMVGWHHRLNGHEFKLQEMVKNREAWHAAAHGVTKSQTWLNNSTYAMEYCCCCCWVASVVSNSVQPHRRQSTRLPHPWDSLGKRVGCHFLTQP